MPHNLRVLIITTVAFVTGLFAATLALVGLVDMDTVSLNSGLPKVAILTPMLAVVTFWAVARPLGAHLDPMRSFLFGGMAVYITLYAYGRLVAHGTFAVGSAASLAVIALFLLAFWTVRSNQVSKP